MALQVQFKFPQHRIASILDTGSMLYIRQQQIIFVLDAG